MGQPLPLPVLEKTGPQSSRIDTRVKAQQPDPQLFPGHLQGEYGHGLSRLFRRVIGDIQGQGGLPHAGPSGDDNQIRRLKTRRQPVKLGKTRGDTGDESVRVGHALQFLETVFDDILKALKAVLDLFLRDFKNGLLRQLQEISRVFPLLETGLGNGRTAGNQLPPDGMPLDDLRVKCDAGGRGHGFHQGYQVITAAGLFQPFFSGKKLRDGNDIDGFAAVIKIEHPLENSRVGLPVKIVRHQDIRHLVDGVIVHQYAAQDRLFRLKAVGRDLQLDRRRFFFWLGHLLFPGRRPVILPASIPLPDSPTPTPSPSRRGRSLRGHQRSPGT